jgi:hypothetical protein
MFVVLLRTFGDFVMVGGRAINSSKMRQGAGCCVRRRAVHSGAFFSLLGRVAAPVLLCQPTRICGVGRLAGGRR